MSANEMQPDIEEVLQVEEPEGRVPSVDVKVTGPVRTQSLPRKGGSTLTRTVGTITATTPALRILTADHKRAEATLMSIGQNMLVAFSQASAQDASRMALWPANVPFVVKATTDVYVASATATTSISIINEMWAVGDGRD